MAFVALDLGGVLCDLRPLAFATELARCTHTTPADVERAFDGQVHRQMECGQADPERFRAAMLTGLGATLTDAEFDRCWNLLPVPRPGADALVARLRIPHAIWSNTDPIHAAHLTAGLQAIARATHRHFSFAAHARKPQTAFYQSGLDALGAKAQDVLFVDDREENLAAAAALGVAVAHVTSLDTLGDVLAQHALLAEAA